MSGHTPTLLELTPTPTGTTISVLLDLLRRSYHMESVRRPERGPSATRFTGSITLGDTRLMLEVNTRPDPRNGSQEYLTIDLDSRAYEVAYDLLREEVHPRGRQALVDFCVEVAATLRVEGFRLRFLNDDDEDPLSIERLGEAMTSTDKCGLACGVSTSSALNSRVRTYWFKAAKEIDGYLVVVLI